MRAQSSDKNYIISRTYKSAQTSFSNNVKDASQQVSYIDGLGRPLQTVSAQTSPLLSSSTPADLVSHTEYDNYGRQMKIYAPYPVQGNGAYQSSASSESIGYYNNAANFCQPNDRGYSLTEYETNPLNRVKKQFAAGTDRAVEYSYGINGNNEVKKYNVSGSSVSQSDSYDGNQLTFTETKDENGSRVREYKDKANRTILKRAYNGAEELSTYYVYNDLSQLCFVLQPQYQDEGNLDKYAFKYVYNDRGLVSSKYVPGGGATSMSYDEKDRLIKSTDGRGVNTYYKYDDLNRIIESGEGVLGSSENALVKTYYDNYSPPFGGSEGFSSFGDGYPSANKTDVKGKVTVVATRVLNPNGSYGSWLYATTYYDERYNIIQTIRSLYDLGGTSIERVTRQVRFDGLLLKERTVQETSTGNYTVEKTYNYDHADRLLDTKYLVKKGSDVQKEIVLSANRYNASGQLKNKFLHSIDGGNTFREQLEHCFTPRMWMSKVTGKNSAADNFGVELKYATLLNANTVAQYNGNISEMLWRQSTGSWVGYKFDYDGVNRLINAEGISGNAYRETIPTYDKNGNIKSLQRYNGGITWDNLSYSYDGNRLTKVTDSGSSDGFNNGSSGDGDDYNYDGNGNATRDQNRGINTGNLKYNYLNLPREILIADKTLQYHYDAAGSKLRISNSNGATNTKYTGIFEYGPSNYPTRIATEEGQISITNNGITYAVEYYLKDHQANTRMVMNEAGAMVQETEYFAFGLEVPKATNKYTFLGREKQPETGWMDLMKRFYDPTIGRFVQVDPITDTQENYSTYQYGWNNPILRSDPNGDCPFCGLVIGAAVDYGFQVAGNVLNGKPLNEAFTKDISLSSIGVSALAGAATSGFSAFGGRTTQFLTGTTIDAIESVAKQIITGVSQNKSFSESVTIAQTFSDVISNKVAGAILHKTGIEIDTKTAERQASRTARVSANDPSSSGRAAKAAAAKGSLTQINNINQITSGVTGNTIQNTSNAVSTSVSTSSTTNNKSMASDATKVQNPFNTIKQ